MTLLGDTRRDTFQRHLAWECIENPRCHFYRLPANLQVKPRCKSRDVGFPREFTEEMDTGSKKGHFIRAFARKTFEPKWWPTIYPRIHKRNGHWGSQRAMLPEDVQAKHSSQNCPKDGVPRSDPALYTHHENPSASPLFGEWMTRHKLKQRSAQN